MLRYARTQVSIYGFGLPVGVLHHYFNRSYKVYAKRAPSLPAFFTFELQHKSLTSTQHVLSAGGCLSGAGGLRVARRRLPA
jgi:hypothetical protein